MRQRFTRLLSFLTVCFILAHFSSPAQAALQAVGPTDLVTTIPSYYMDTANLALMPCIDQNGFCILGPPFSPLTPPVSPITTTGPINGTNFPFEAFYYWADAALIPIEGGAGQPAGDRLRLTYVLEYAFLQGVTPNAAITFLRTDIQKMIHLVPNSTYRVTHPYGVLEFATDALGDTAAGGGVAIRQEDPFGSALQWMPPLMKSAAFTNMGPFLTRPTGLITDIPTGNKYIGDARTYTPVIGGPNGNIVKVERLSAGVPVGAAATWTTANFALAGRVFTGQIPSAMNIDRVTYARDALGATQIDVFATALPTAILSISGTTGLAITALTQDFPATGKYFANIPGAALPTGVSITNSLDIPSIPHPVTLVDEVIISQADYNPVTRSLTIKAASRDHFAPLPSLTVTGFTPSTLDATGTVVLPLPANTIPPMTVTVVSSKLGAATAFVSVATPTAVPLTITTINPITKYPLVAIPYVNAILPTGGTAPYTRTLSAGLLPPGITFFPASGDIFGVPTTAGTYNFTFTVTDSLAATTSQSYTLVITPPLTINTVKPITTFPLGVVPYVNGVLPTGGTAPYTLSLVAGSLPPGVSFFPAGDIFGVPTTAGSYTFTLQVVDGVGSSNTQTYTLVIL